MKKCECTELSAVSLSNYVCSARVHLITLLTVEYAYVTLYSGLCIFKLSIVSCNAFVFWSCRVLTPVLRWTATYEFMVGVCVDVLQPLISAQLLQPLPRLEILLRNFHARFVGSKWMPTNVYISLKGRHKVNLSIRLYAWCASWTAPQSNFKSGLAVVHFVCVFWKLFQILFNFSCQ
jgi:hypothetical protein